MRGNTDTVQDCTSQVFEGMISMAEPSDSWVAKWQRIQGYVPGLYAVKVVGIVSERGCSVEDRITDEANSCRKITLLRQRTLVFSTSLETDLHRMIYDAG